MTWWAGLDPDIKVTIIVVGVAMYAVLRTVFNRERD